MKRKMIIVLGLVLIIGCAMLISSGCSADVKGKEFTSTVTNGHTHTVLIPDSDYKNPPSEKVYTLSKGRDGHTHKIVLRQVDFSNMSRGIAVACPTSNTSDGHSHEITIK